LVPGGRLLVADILTSSDLTEAELHNALERFRDPTHVRMLTQAELESLLCETGIQVAQSVTWEHRRSFGEWAAIVSDPARAEPLRTVMLVHARSG